MTKHVLVTAGATIVPIDQVRAITNIFKGKTGTAIAENFATKGYEVTLLTSNPGLLDVENYPTLEIISYRTYDELLNLMKQEICGGRYAVVIHSAAVSDYKVDGVFDRRILGELVRIDNSSKVSSDHEELYLRLSKTEKIIDLIREPWGFKGYLVKFKLQVGISDLELLQIAKASREHSEADMIVANCLEWAKDYAYVLTNYEMSRVLREALPEEIEHRIRRTFHG